MSAAQEWAALLLDAARHDEARTALLALDEEAIPALVEVFYAGVSEADGLLLLELIGQIGGYEAVNLLRDVYDHERPLWREAAAHWLRQDGFIS